MATRSLIGIQYDDGSIEYIYCHWDGYPDHQLPILKDYYNDLDSVEELIDLGDISYLDKYIEPEDPDSTHSFDHPDPEVVIAYNRDRGDSWSRVKPKYVGSEEEYIEAGSGHWVDYLYLYDASAGGWRYFDFSNGWQS